MTPQEALNILSQICVSKAGLNFNDILISAQAIQTLREFVEQKPAPSPAVEPQEPKP